MELSDCCAAILVGGASRRMGTSKALVSFRGVPLALHIARVMKPEVAAVCFVGSEPLPAEILEQSRAVQVPDIGPQRSSLNGVYSALVASKHEWVCVLACDAPLPCVALLKEMAKFATADTQVVACREPGGGLQPFHALWHRTVAADLERLLARGELGLQNAMRQLHREIVEPDTWKRFDPNADFLLNLNTPDDLSELGLS